jgi:hypothetical protein
VISKTGHSALRGESSLTVAQLQVAKGPYKEAGRDRVSQTPQAHPQDLGDYARKEWEIWVVPRSAFPRPFAEDGGDTELRRTAAGAVRRGRDVVARTI